MKKIIFLFTLVLASAIFSGYKSSAGKTDQKNAKSSNKTVANESGRKAPDGKPRILFLLSNDKRVNSSLWWKYDNTVTKQEGC